MPSALDALSRGAFEGPITRLFFQAATFAPAASTADGTGIVQASIIREDPQNAPVQLTYSNDPTIQEYVCFHEDAFSTLPRIGNTITIDGVVYRIDNEQALRDGIEIRYIVVRVS